MSSGRLGQSLQVVLVFADSEIREWLANEVSNLSHELVSVWESLEQFQKNILQLAQVPGLVITDITASKTLDSMYKMLLQRKVDTPFILVTKNVEELLQANDKEYVVGRYVFPLLPEQLQAAVLMAVYHANQTKQLREAAQNAERRLRSLTLINQAKGILQEMLDLTESQSHRRLRELATSRGVTVEEHARALMEAYKLFFPHKGKPKRKKE